MTIMYVVHIKDQVYGPFGGKIEARSFLKRTTGSITGMVMLVTPPSVVADNQLTGESQ